MKTKNIDAILLLTLVVAGVIIGLIYPDASIYIKDKFFPHITTQEVINSNQSDSYILKKCDGLNLKQTAFCLRNELAPLINYTVRDETKYRGNDGSFDDVLKNGGDCTDYNGFYYKWGKDLGFKTVQTTLIISSEDAHVFTTIFDSSGYCLMDQDSIPDCFTFAPFKVS